MYQVTDPGFSPVERIVPASPTNKEKGHYAILVRRIPWVKWRDLAQRQVRAHEKKKTVERLLDAWSAETPKTGAELTAWDERGAVLVDAINAAEREQESVVREVVSWGIAGTKDLVDANRVEHPFSFVKQEWLGKEWALLSEQTLDLYQLLGLLGALFSFVTQFQSNKLPETLDGFFIKAEEKAVVVAMPSPKSKAVRSNRLR